MCNSNVCLDFSICETKPFGESYIAAASDAIADKIVFASANPFVEVEKVIKKYQKLPLMASVREKMFYLNGARFLGLANIGVAN